MFVGIVKCRNCGVTLESALYYNRFVGSSGSIGFGGNRTIAKVGSAESCQGLLQQFNIKGSSTVGRIFASDNFTQFAALDDAGLAYILQEVETPFLGR